MAGALATAARFEVLAGAARMTGKPVNGAANDGSDGGRTRRRRTIPSICTRYNVELGGRYIRHTGVSADFALGIGLGGEPGRKLRHAYFSTGSFRSEPCSDRVGPGSPKP